MARVYFFIVFSFIFVYQSSAQVDTEYWFAPPEVSASHGDRPIYIRVSTLNQAATIQVTQPALQNKLLGSVTLAANRSATINLTAWAPNLETNLPATVMKTGIRVTSTTPITAYYEVIGQGARFVANGEIFALKGRNALGNKFVIPGQNFYNNNGIYNPIPNSSFDIVATRNNTIVKIKPTKTLVGYAGLGEITIKLNAGETYSFRKPTLLAADNPIGTIVESTQPIAITIKDDSIINGGCHDLVGDQIVPVKVTGTEYIVLRGALTTTEFLFITATEDNTQLFVGGSSTPVTTIQAGQIYRYTINNAATSTYIKSNKPIYVFHATGNGCELGMALLPSINCKGSDQIAFSRTTEELFILNILVRKEGISHFTLNGSSGLVQAANFSAVPGTGDVWYWAQITPTLTQLPIEQPTLISNSQHSFQIGIINGGTTTSARYGYFSAFSTLFIGDDFTICTGETATLDAGTGKDSYLWSTGATTRTIQVNQAGEYSVYATREGCELHDTVAVRVKTGAVDIGPDVEICTNETARIDGKENFSWLWSNGSTEQFLETTVPGEYSLSVIDYNGCPATDIIRITRKTYDLESVADISLSYVSVDTTDDHRIHLKTSIDYFGELRGDSVFVYKQYPGASDWFKIFEMPASQDLFIDAGNMPDNGPHGYYVSLTDACGSEGAVSQAHHSIHLQGNSNDETEEAALQWTPYAEWKNGVDRYEVWKKLDDQSGYQLLATFNGNETTYSDSSGGDGFLHTYVVRAIENQGLGESWSNTIQVEFEHAVSVYNIVTAGSDGYNPYFYISKIELYKDSELVIMNRWGKKVFETTGYKNDWSGEGVESGVYYYVLNLKRKNKIVKGIISVFR